MNRDLTQGSPRSVIWRFSLPLFFSVLVQQLYVVTDSLVAGRFIGETALASVGNTYQITLLYQAVAFGCTVGCSVVVSRLFGAKKTERLRSAVTTALIASVGLSVALTAAGILGGGALLGLMHTPQEMFAGSKQYLDIYSAGIVFLFLYQIVLGIFAALGDAKTPFWFLTVTSLANILLDFVFVVALHMEVAGVAWATFACQAGGAIVSLAFLLRKLQLEKLQHGETESQTEHIAVFSGGLLREMLNIALPVILQQAIISVGGILIQGNVNSFGSGVSAGYAAAIKMNNMAIMGLMAFDKGMTSYTAQNKGAQRPERIRAGLRAGIRLSVGAGILIGAVYLVFRYSIIQLFLKTADAEALATGVQYLQVVVPFYVFVSIKIVCDGVLRGLGAMRQLLTGTFVDLALRVGCGFLLSSLWGPVGIWAAWPIGWIVGMVVSAWFAKRLI